MANQYSDVIGTAIKATGDVTSVGVVVATIVNLLPPLAALASILWVGFQFYNSAPMQAWLAKRRASKEE